MVLGDFIYNTEHKVVVCRQCETCLVPDGPKKWGYHLRREPHRLKGERLRTTIDLLSTYDLRGQDELRRHRPDRRVPRRAIVGLAAYAASICTCDRENCDFVTRRARKMDEHLSRHGRTASEQRTIDSGAALWEPCVVQTYFTAKGRIDYFVVEGTAAVGDERGGTGPPSAAMRQDYTGPRPSSPEMRLLDGLRADVRQAAHDLEEKAAVVEEPGQDRGDRERWLVYTGFPTHLRGLRDEEIRSSFRLPKKTNILLSGSARGVKRQGWAAKGSEEAEEEVEEEEDDLRRILAATEVLLRKAYNLVADRSLERKMTHQRAQKLSDFASGIGKKGRDIAFRCFKNESTLVTYFRTMKELLVYYYRVVYHEGGHFTRVAEDQRLPQDVIEAAPKQREAMDEILDALRQQDVQDVQDGGDGCWRHNRREEDPKLQHAIRKFYMRLICHEVGSSHFRSPVLSFCAMVSRTRAYGGKHSDKIGGDKEKKGGWHDPGNFSGCLSALVWTAQLVLFEAVCHSHKNDEGQIPAALGKLCEEYMHQGGETTFGHILQWRLYLATVARSAITRRQARWSWDGLEITYLGTTLHMGHISQLIVSEYKRACDLLFGDLMFGARDIASIEAWRVHDDLDTEDYGGSWLTDGRNRDLLRGADVALLKQIECRADLRKTFMVDGDNSSPEKKLCPRAMAVYEASVQEFLKALVPLMHVSPMPPLRSHEFLTMIYANSGSRRRSMLIWEKMLMIYIRYSKSQEQTGKDGDNLRFIPPAIANLVMTFLGLVQPLRQVFLRQVQPGKLLSPYLFSTLDGTVWQDEMVSKCLSRACARAEVPEFKVAWWRQAAASITKEKFAPRERANFNMEEIDTPEAVEEEDLIVDLAEGSNHSFRTFNHAYAGSTTLAMNTLLHRAFRASLSWRTLFKVDELLAEETARGRGKRGRSALGLEPLGGAYKKAKVRSRPLQTERGLEETARALHNDPTLRLRRPGQRDAMLAAMGPGAAEQVVVVLATGSGKTLIVMVAAALEGAGTTIMVLPTVALRGSMVDRLAKIGIRFIVWSPGETMTAPLVLMSAEAACSNSFLDYAHRLESKQEIDRIVIDEGHLTITASFRRSMRELGSYVRQIRTQTVWLTATLPPDLEPSFISHNMLVRPRIVRESTNRANIRYLVRRCEGPGRLCGSTAELVRPYEAAIREAGVGSGGGHCTIDGGERARIIVYCQTIELMQEISGELGCPTYTGDQESMSEEDKEAAIRQWLGPSGSPVIVATSALGVGLDYPHVRWVIHAGAPRRMTDFSQESGRAGRDGKLAESIVLLSAAWQPFGGGQHPQDADEEFMQLYLTQQYCSRAVMSQYLDARPDWRWCMRDSDELCGACPTYQTGTRPTTLELALPRPVDVDDGAPDGGDMAYTGPKVVCHRRMLEEDALERFRADLDIMRGCCLLCCIKGNGRPFDHDPKRCNKRSDWQNAKKRVLAACRKENQRWMANFTACFLCYLPQTICSTADPEAKASADGCQFADMIMPLCYGAFYAPGPRALVNKHLTRDEAI